MSVRWKAVCKVAGAALLLPVAAGLAAPFISAGPYGARLRMSLGRALGRAVEIRGPVRFSLFRGPGFSADNVVIHEDPSIGFEPIAYVDTIHVRPSLRALLGGRFVIASIRLEDATLNLTKSGPAGEAGRWNFVSFVNRSVMSTAPAIHIRGGRINFKFGDTKSIFYLMDTDLDIAPPGTLRGGWNISCEGQAGRTDKPALGLGSFTLIGKWYLAPERVDLDLRLERTEIEDFAVLMSGQAGGVHGTISSRLHLAGPLNGIGVLGRLTMEDVHRWDLLPPKGHGWPMDIRGRLDLLAQQLELQSTSSVVPLTTRFRVSDFLSRPHWAVTMTWNQFPLGPVLQLARDMGAQVPARLEMNGTIDGAISYSPQRSLEGELALHKAAVTIPDAPPLRFEQMRVMFGQGHVWLAPTPVRTAQHDEFRLEANYSITDDTLDLSIATDGMKVQSLRAQAALAAVPWLEQVNSGVWRGQVHYHREPETTPRWTGALDLADAEMAIPGLADPLEIASARVGLDGERVGVDRILARTGKIAFTGAYRYEPGTAHPLRVRLRASRVDAADLEAELKPTLRRNAGLLARAFGRTTVPDWLRERKLEGSVQILDLELGGAHVENVRARVVWDLTRVNLLALVAKLDGAALNGSLAITLGPQRPSYQLTAKLKDLLWQSGKLDAEGTLEAAGLGPQLLSSLRLTDLSLRTEDDIFTGSGSIEEDGRLLLLLTNGNREMRMSGTLATLKWEEPGGAARAAQ
jgi:hypothetical protein